MAEEKTDNFHFEKLNYFARKSFRHFMIGLSFLILFIVMIPATSQNAAICIDLCLIGTWIYATLAFVYSCRSFYGKEKSLRKYAGALGSIILIYIPFYLFG